MSKSFGLPVHPSARGVTVIVAVISVEPELVATNEAIFPVPLVGSPSARLLLVQLNVVPLTKPEKITALVGLLLHTSWSEGSSTFGVGFTSIVKDCSGPVQPLAVGVTVIMATTGAEPVFNAEKDAMSPLPLVARPIEGWLFVQLNVVPATALLKIIGVVEAPLHIAWSAIGSTTGSELTVKVAVSEIVALTPQSSVITTRYSVWSGSSMLPAFPIVMIVALGIPMEIKSASVGLFLCQSKFAVPAAPVMLASKSTEPPAQITWLRGCFVNEILLGQV